jgi:hypothetical protein
MIILDVRRYGKDLTLENCGELYDKVRYMHMSVQEFHIKVQRRELDDGIIIAPDELWVTKWQHENIFSSLSGPWEYWRGIPIKVKDV